MASLKEIVQKNFRLKRTQAVGRNNEAIFKKNGGEPVPDIPSYLNLQVRLINYHVHRAKKRGCTEQSGWQDYLENLSPRYALVVAAISDDWDHIQTKTKEAFNGTLHAIREKLEQAVNVEVQGALSFENADYPADARVAEVLVYRILTDPAIFDSRPTPAIPPINVKRRTPSGYYDLDCLN